MSYINNMNPRRMIWFNQNAPKNKMDLWLSYNRHYEDTSEDETVDPQLVDDNPNQRKCDLILKAWDCGKWVPIVGFNSTAANKIDTVEGNTLYHPAIFTGENPNDLYDAGTLGSLLSDQHFVSELEWYDVFNSTDYSWDNIFGDTNWFGDLIWETIQGGSSTYHLPWATTEVCGGILSDIHTYDAISAFKPIEVKFYPSTNAYSSKLHRLCVSASDVIQLINNYYNDNPSGSTVNIQLANTERIGGIKAAQDPNASDDCRNIPIVLAGPTVGSVWGLPFGSGTYPGDTDNETEYLYLPGWALREWLENPYLNGSGDTNPIISGWRGTRVRGRQDESGLWIELDGIALANDGQIPKRKTVSGEVSIEWVDLPSGTTYSTLASGSSSGTTYVVKGGSDDKHFLNGNGEWVVPDSEITYVGGVGIYINPSGNTININTSGATKNNQFIAYDGSGDVEWTKIVNAGNNTITLVRQPGELAISAEKRETVWVPDASGNVYIGSSVTTESNGNYKFTNNRSFVPLLLGYTSDSDALSLITIDNTGSYINEKTYVRFRTKNSASIKQVLKFTKELIYCPTFSASGHSVYYDSETGYNTIDLITGTDYYVEVVSNFITLEKLTKIYNSNIDS